MSEQPNQPPSDSQARDHRLSIRTSSRQDDLIKAAAQASNKTVSDFVLDSASVAAENVLMDRRLFVANEAEWDQLNALLDRPAVFKPRLAASLKSVAE
ncbi:MAG: DUF1778 domain-containing protein [Actinobacteria bacterium]|nr:DUF1778 domain-containing protein [Actinomycetota bacterium]